MTATSATIGAPRLAPNGGLACAVLSLGDERGLVDAVHSLAEQHEPVEIVVVNSGGGDPKARLAGAGIDVPVVNRRDRLLPGAVRNLGIAATRSRYVSFLAADCWAEPGWVAGRLREHAGGADAVACAMTNPFRASASAHASFLLLHHRRTVSTPESDRLLYGLSYDRELFDRFGRFREDLRVGEDTELNARFSPDIRVAWASDVRTAHRYPTNPARLLREQYVRGRRHALGLAPTQGTPARVVARNALRNARHCTRLVAGEHDRRPPGARPLLLAGGLSYAAGALAAGAASPLTRRRVDRSVRV